jgi:hypothetical protein
MSIDNVVSNPPSVENHYVRICDAVRTFLMCVPISALFSYLVLTYVLKVILISICI